MIETLTHFIDFFLHIDRHLLVAIERYDVWIYAILFLIVFCETGLVVTPILPGDSLLFAAGTFAAAGALNLWLVLGLFFVAAVLGDAVNYAIGFHVGPRVFHERSRFFKREYLLQTERFYERHGSKTIVIARFVPIVRTFAPFVAGIGRMAYARFALYNVLGAVLWTGICVLAGHFFGNIPVVREHFSFVVLGIVIVSVLPGVWEILRHRRQRSGRWT